MRACSTCKVEKALDAKNFYRSKNEKNGFGYECKLCTKTRQHDRWKNNPDFREQIKESYQRNWQRNYRKRKYNLTQTEYECLLQKFDNCCAICKGNECLCIDHCHVTGMIRGILCRNCNSAIGKLKESVSNLKAAISYLEAIPVLCPPSE